MSTCSSATQSKRDMMTLFKKLYGQKDYSDITIKFSERQIYGHKAILCNRSEYFQKLFGHGSNFAESDQKVVELKDDDAGALELMLMHLYFATYDLHAQSQAWQFHAGIARVADKYLVRDLKSEALAKCIAILTAIADPVRVCDALLEIKGQFNDMEELTEQAAYMQKKHITALLQQPRFLESLSEDEKNAQLSELSAQLSKLSEQLSKLSGIIGGQAEKKGWVCNKCARVYEYEVKCLKDTCNGTTKASKYWISKA